MSVQTRDLQGMTRAAGGGGEHSGSGVAGVPSGDQRGTGAGEGGSREPLGLTAEQGGAKEGEAGRACSDSHV